jgi:chromosomal replication initiation ATPase DnaA
MHTHHIHRATQLKTYIEQTPTAIKQRQALKLWRRTIELAIEALKPKQPDASKLIKIQTAVCKAFEVQAEAFYSKSRKREIVMARQAYCLLAFKAGFTYDAMAAHLGQEHSNALASVRVAQGLIEIGDVGFLRGFERMEGGVE